MKKSIMSTLLIVPTTMLTLALTQDYIAHADDNPANQTSSNAASTTEQSNANSNSTSNPTSTTESSASQNNIVAQSTTNVNSQDNSAAQANNQSSNSNQSNDQSSTNNQNNSSNNQSNSTNQNNDNGQSPNNNQTDQNRHKYDQVKVSKKVNFDTVIKKNSNLYKGGAYNTKISNIKKNGNSSSLKQKWVHVSELQTTKKGTYAHIFHNHHDKGWINKNAFDNTAFKLNDVPLIAQRPQLPTGCEITAVTMMINYATGKKYSKTYMANRMPRSSNPNKGFVGSPYSKAGWYIYPPALMKLVKHYVGASVNLTGKSTNYLKNYVQKYHRPVVVYVANVDGFPNHALTITGFTKDRIYYNDPWLGKRTSMDIKSLNIHRSNDGHRAISY